MSRTFARPGLHSLLGLLCLASALPAQAIGCGSVLTASVTLTADLVCGPGQDGLVIGANAVRIELNGFNMIGPDRLVAPTGPSVGVRSNGFDSVQIVGPGTITGFKQAIRIEGGDYHLLSNVKALAESGLPVSVRNSSYARVEYSRMNALELVSDIGQKAVGNYIGGNEISPEPGMAAGGVTMAGCGTFETLATGNFVYGVPTAFHVTEGSHANQVLKNKIAQGRIYLEGSSQNVVAANTSHFTALAYAGVFLDTSLAPVACARGVRPRSTNNTVRDNSLYGGTFGIFVDDWTLTRAPGTNLITANTVYDATHGGILLGQSAIGNDARGNTYVNVLYPVVDFGSGNLYP